MNDVQKKAGDLACAGAPRSEDEWDTGQGSLDVPDGYTAVNKSPRRLDALKLALGKGTYADDLELDGVLFVKVLWSPHAHARIVSIDTTEAEKVPGVRCVLHHGNVPRVAYTTAGQGHPEPSPYDSFMFDAKVRFVGDRVACVAADSERAAAIAVSKIKVEYDVLPAIFDPRAAFAEGAVQIHDEPEAVGLPGYDKTRNIAAAMHVDHGDVDGAFARLVDVRRPYADQKEDVTDRFTRVYLAALIAHTGGNQSEAARLAGLNRSYLGRLLVKHGLARGGSGGAGED